MKSIKGYFYANGVNDHETDRVTVTLSGVTADFVVLGFKPSGASEPLHISFKNLQHNYQFQSTSWSGRLPVVRHYAGKTGDGVYLEFTLLAAGLDIAQYVELIGHMLIATEDR